MFQIDPATTVIKLDRTQLLIRFASGFSEKLLSPYGEVTNVFLRINSLVLRLYSEDSDGRQLQEIVGLPGVLLVEYNQLRAVDELHHYAAPTTGLAGLNSAARQAMNLPAAWDITRGDPRVVIGVIDSGVDLRHYDIRAEAGGIFMKGEYLPPTGFPVKIVASEFFRDVMPKIKILQYDPRRSDARNKTIPQVLVPAYRDSACNVAYSTDSNGFLIPPNVGVFGNVWYAPGDIFWINEPVDVYMEFSGGEDSYGDTIIITGYQFAAGRREMYDGFGHGTACTGLISGRHDRNGLLGVAPDCTTVHFKHISDDGAFIGEIDQIAALNASIDRGCHILSTSWGGDHWTSQFYSMCDAVLASGMIWFASVGNSGRMAGANVATDPYSFPGAYPGVMGVGSSGEVDPQNVLTGWIDDEPENYDYARVSWFSQKHNRVFILAPGNGMRIHMPLNRSYLWQNYDHSTNVTALASVRSGCGGTSFSCPVMGGIGGLMAAKTLQAYPSVTDPADVTALLHSVCSKAHVSSVLTSTAYSGTKLAIGAGSATVGIGAGRVNAGAAVAAV